MASILRREGKNFTSWRVSVRRKGIQTSRTFRAEAAAREWAEQAETAISDGLDRQRVKALKSGFQHELLATRALGDRDLLDPAAIVAAALPAAAVCGVYFLIERGEIFYVGKSADVFARVMKHRRNGTTFDGFSVLPCPPERLDEYEARYIFENLPRRNKTVSLEALRGQRVTVDERAVELA